MKMFKKRKELAEKKLDEYLRTKYQLIENVKAGDCVVNYRCHSQAVNDSIRNGTEIILVLYRTNDKNIQECLGNITWQAHFINYDKKKKRYIDNTIGHLSKGIEYLFVKKIEKDESVYDLLDEYNKKVDKTDRLFFMMPKLLGKYL